MMAVYLGDSTHLAGNDRYGDDPGSQVQGGSETVNAQTTSVTLKSSGSTAFGAPATFTATVTPAGGAPLNPTGVVTFFNSGVPFGTAPVSTSGGTTTAHFTTNGLLVGSDSITATYSGDENYSGSTTASSLSQMVTAPAAPTHVTVTGPSKVTHGTTYKATATTDGTGGVVFTLAPSPKPKAGLSINPNTGVVTYAVPASGVVSFSYVVIASNAAGDARSTTIKVNVV